ncbi:hypothetical protein Tco_0746450, partial [Tanacetum coccineum]
MFMTNLTSEDRIYDEAWTSYDSNTPFEVQYHDTFVNHLDEYHEVHEMQTNEQHNYVIDSDADYMSNSNITPYDQYVEDNEDHVVQRNVSYVRNDALMSILDEMHEQGVQSRLANKPDMVVNDSVTSFLDLKKLKDKIEDRLYKQDQSVQTVHIIQTGSITRAHTSEKTSTMLNEIESLKAQLRSKEPCFTSDYVKPKVLAPGIYA